MVTMARTAGAVEARSLLSALGKIMHRKNHEGSAMKMIARERPIRSIVVTITVVTITVVDIFNPSAVLSALAERC